MEINAIYLRIGNWVKIGAHHVKVNVFGEKGISHDEGFERYKYVDPIPLTKEMLLKCGFIENGDTSQFHLEEQIVSFNKLDGVHFWIMDTDKCIRCKYLHELQNTWFVFKCKELEIKL